MKPSVLVVPRALEKRALGGAAVDERECVTG